MPIDRKLADFRDYGNASEHYVSVVCRKCYGEFRFSYNKKSSNSLDTSLACPYCKSSWGTTRGYKGMTKIETVRKGWLPWELGTPYPKDGN